MRRVYIAGPCSGIKDLNYPAFHAAADRLRTAGHHVENPAENPIPVCGGTWAGWMRMAIRQLATCDSIHMLPGWEDSRGARIERILAIELGMEFVG